MKLKLVLTVAAIYLTLVGIGVMFFPRRFGVGALPEDPAPALISFMRVFSGPFLGIAAMNWVARNAGPSTARNAIVLGNTVGFACVAAMDIWGVLSGAARPLMKVFLVIHLAMTVAFLLAGRSSMREHVA